jgi:hypothetical protein
MSESRRAGWLWVVFVAPLIVVGLLAMHGLTGSQSGPERGGQAGHEMTRARHHQMPSKTTHDQVHDVVLCLWVLVAAFALVALRERAARLSDVIYASLRSMTTPGRALMRAPPVSVRLSLVGMSRR